MRLHTKDVAETPTAVTFGPAVRSLLGKARSKSFTLGWRGTSRAATAPILITAERSLASPAGPSRKAPRRPDGTSESSRWMHWCRWRRGRWCLDAEESVSKIDRAGSKRICGTRLHDCREPWVLLPHAGGRPPFVMQSLVVANPRGYPGVGFDPDFTVELV
jgi:hypothetical protein